MMGWRSLAPWRLTMGLTAEVACDKWLATAGPGQIAMLYCNKIGRSALSGGSMSHRGSRAHAHARPPSASPPSSRPRPSAGGALAVDYSYVGPGAAGARGRVVLFRVGGGG